MIDYSPAREFADEVRAFAMVETNENEHAVGDGGRAAGILQMHPASFAQFAIAHTKFSVHVSDTSTTAQIKACAAFLLEQDWRTASREERDLITQAWNLGVHGVFGEGKRNSGYLDRWHAAYERIQQEHARRALEEQMIAMTDDLSPKKEGGAE
jgi:hypothetical protein